MAQVCVLDCLTGTVHIRDMTPEEEVRRLADAAEWTAKLEADAATAAQRESDIATVRWSMTAAGSTAGSSAALLRLLKA